MKSIFLLLAVISFYTHGSILAQHGDQQQGESDHETHVSHSHWNHMAIFAGATSKFEKQGTHFTLGLDYVRKFPPSGRWAVSVFGEAIFEEHTEWLFGIPIIYWPSDHIWLRIGPGIEILKEEEHHHTETKAETKIEFLWRIGIGYEIESRKYTITPSIDIDFERSTTALVWGFNFGYGF